MWFFTNFMKCNRNYVPSLFHAGINFFTKSFFLQPPRWLNYFCQFFPLSQPLCFIFEIKNCWVLNFFPFTTNWFYNTFFLLSTAGFHILKETNFFPSNAGLTLFRKPFSSFNGDEYVCMYVCIWTFIWFNIVGER